MFLRNDKAEREVIHRKMRQMWILSVSLMTQYLSAICFAIAGLIGGLLKEHISMDSAMRVLLCIGVGFIVIALGFLIVYAKRSVSIKRDQFKIKFSEQ